MKDEFERRWEHDMREVKERLDPGNFHSDEVKFKAARHQSEYLAMGHSIRYVKREIRAGKMYDLIFYLAMIFIVIRTLSILIMILGG